MAKVNSCVVRLRHASPRQADKGIAIGISHRDLLVLDKHAVLPDRGDVIDRYDVRLVHAKEVSGRQFGFDAL